MAKAVDKVEKPDADPTSSSSSSSSATDEEPVKKISTMAFEVNETPKLEAE
jgi:hypothetical protein